MLYIPYRVRLRTANYLYVPPYKLAGPRRNSFILGEPQILPNSNVILESRDNSYLSEGSFILYLLSRWNFRLVELITGLIG